MCPQLCKDSPTQSLIDCNSPPVSSPFLIEKVAYLLQGKGSNLPAVISCFLVLKLPGLWVTQQCRSSTPN